MERTIFSAGIVVFYQTDTDRLYLILHYPHDHWDFAKGKLEPGETNHQAALRELQEETALTTEIIPGFQTQLDYTFTTKKGGKAHKTVTFFTGQSHTQNVYLSQEHINYVWLPFEQALERLSYDNAKKVLKEVHTFLG